MYVVLETKNSIYWEIYCLTIQKMFVNSRLVYKLWIINVLLSKILIQDSTAEAIYVIFNGKYALMKES